MGENTIQIIPYYAHPHVHVVINDNTFYDETTGTPTEVDLPYSTLVITGADQGIDNTFVRISELSTKKAIFGEGNFQKYGQASLQADFLFNGSTNVWFCRVLPDNATYANMILLVNYREGNDLDDLGQATGLKRMEVKFAVSYSAKPYVVDGAVDDDTITETARSLETIIPDPKTGYLRVPIAYIRSIGRGKYGNKYSMSITRDTNAEKEYDCKMYLWSLVENGVMSRVINTFAGSIYQTAVNNVSTLISDVLDQYSTGSCPVKIYSFEDNFDKLFAFYQNIVEKNTAFLATSNPTDEQLKDLAFAQAMHETAFLKYGGDVKIEQFNFGGLGATGGVPGNKFPDIRTGVRAQIQHLKAYASTAPLKKACVDERFKYVERGCAPYIEYLSSANNPKGKGWAKDPAYAEKINKYVAEIKSK